MDIDGLSVYGRSILCDKLLDGGSRVLNILPLAGIHRLFLARLERPQARAGRESCQDYPNSKLTEDSPFPMIRSESHVSFHFAPNLKLWQSTNRHLFIIQHSAGNEFRRGQKKRGFANILR